MDNINEGDINEARMEGIRRDYRSQEANRKQDAIEIEYEKSLDDEFSERKAQHED